MSFKPLWTDVLGETATLLSLCYFCEMQYAFSAIWNNLGCFSTLSSSSASSGAGPQLPVPTCDCIIWDAMSGSPRKRLECEQSTCSQAPVVPQQFHSEPGPSFHTPCLLSSLFHHFTAVRGPEALLPGGGKVGERPRALPMHAQLQC